ncbi:MAG: flavocytochrome c [Fusobacterium gastrosuis]|uniref:flavocytochrome c n=1 Tax=Fusobacterium gastrosuis TaxID=1755100 RepID=UPI0025DBFDF1|nr:flavocytochrome c [uncultured Fusobacterium sp.]MDD7409854.1 flavocytochrome c [Fusobacteriaceae bacterium]MDY4010066.1 flavocytochrome c [Fusobacterium gastrosuis]MDY5712435.1 flavocytochrome c [Fusobacterium gastrosuis]
MKKRFSTKFLTLVTGLLLSYSAFAGTYNGVAKGFGGDIIIDAEIANNKLEAINVKSESESDFAKPAIKAIIGKVIATQSLDVDNVAGATATSKGIKGAISKAVKASGATLTKVEEKSAVQEKSTETDIVVIGGGGAGITAAIAAHEKGAKVILLEKTALLGGNTNYATGGINAAGTKIQKEAGIEDSPELFMQDTMKGGKGVNNKELVKVMTENSAGIVDWLVERGVDITEVTYSGGQSVKRIHRPTGGVAVGPVVVSGLTKVLDKEKIDYRTSDKAVEILKTGNKVSGVKVSGANGDYTIKAKAVIVATGGFGANAEMVEKYNPNLKGFGTTNSPAILGEGIEMVQKVGGDLVDMKEIQTHPTVVHKKPYMITESVRGEGAILINRDAKRFINELETRDVVSKAVLDQKEGSAYILFNQEIREKLKAADGYVKKGYAVEGTLDEIAKQLGIDGKTLKETVEKYNEAVRLKVDNEFNKTNFARELLGNKFYAIEISPAIHHTMGGVRINTNAEVLAKNGKAIRGLYAAGEVTGGVHGANRIGGNAVTDITVFGKIAGENAATYIKSVK